jgi:hypothetical protein
MLEIVINSIAAQTRQAFRAAAGYRKITVFGGRPTLSDVSLTTVLRLLTCCRIKGQMGGL